MSERVLSVKQIVVELLKGWKLILLCMVIGGCILGLLKIVADKNTVENSSAQKEVTAEELGDLLTDEERKSVQDAVNYYYTIEQLRDYLDSSIKLSYDGNDVPYTYYLIDIELKNEEAYTIEQKQETISNLIFAYSAYIGNGSFGEKVANMSDGVEEQYVKELFAFSYNADKDNMSSFFVKFYRTEQIPDLDTMVAELVLQHSEELSSNIAPHSLKITDSYSGVGVDSTIIDLRRAQSANLYDSTTKLKNLTNAFNAEQMRYYNKVLGLDEVIEENVKQGYNIDWKYVIVGVVLGIMLACMWILIKILFSSCVVSASDYEVKFGAMHIGTIYNNIHANKTTSKLERWEYGESISHKDIVAYVGLKVKRALDVEENNKLAILSSNIANVPDEIVSNLVSFLEKQEIEVVLLDGVLTSGEQLQTLFNLEKCILLETRHKSRIKDIEEIVELCTENKVKILGVVDTN